MSQFQVGMKVKCFKTPVGVQLKTIDTDEKIGFMSGHFVKEKIMLNDGRIEAPCIDGEFEPVEGELEVIQVDPYVVLRGESYLPFMKSHGSDMQAELISMVMRLTGKSTMSLYDQLFIADDFSWELKHGTEIGENYFVDKISAYFMEEDFAGNPMASTSASDKAKFYALLITTDERILNLLDSEIYELCPVINDNHVLDITVDDVPFKQWIKQTLQKYKVGSFDGMSAMQKAISRMSGEN